MLVLLLAALRSVGSAAQTHDEPGRLEIDEDAAERALERTLVSEGTRLLRPGWIDMQPSLSYSFNQIDVPAVVQVEGDNLVGSRQVQRERVDSGIGLRFGLPLRSQIELALPYHRVSEGNVIRVSNQGLSQSSVRARGRGDLRIGVAKTLVEEGRLRPQVVARFQYAAAADEPSGDNQLLRSGFDARSAVLSFTKRQDPLVFFGDVGYTTFAKRDGMEPADVLSLTFGAGLAVSPETSLIVALKHVFADKTRSAGIDLPGSDATAISLRLGGATMLARGVLLSVHADVGLTDNAPEYAVHFALPVRFRLPGAR